MLIQANQSVKHPVASESYRYEVTPTHVIALETVPCDGCEPAPIATLFISFVVNMSVVDLAVSNPHAVGVRAGRILFFNDSPMNERELNREVSKKTGENVSIISALGFIPLTGQPYEREPN